MIYRDCHPERIKAALGTGAILIIHLASSCSVQAAEDTGSLWLSGQVTGGVYSNSIERSGYSNRMLDLTYNKTDDYSASLSVMYSTLNWKHSPESIDTVAPGIRLTKWIAVSPQKLLGIKMAVTGIDSNDSNVDNRIVPYLSIMGKSKDGSNYVDLGYAYSDFTDSTINQFTASYGFSLYNSRLWLRTRLYYLDMGNRPVNGTKNTTAIEQKVTWYAIPEKLSLTLSGLAGRRIYGYDPDTSIVYTVPDILRGSGGITISYAINPHFRIYSDVSYESYRNPSIDNNYGVTYLTAGVSYGL